jgi:hypothetical protein
VERQQVAPGVDAGLGIALRRRPGRGASSVGETPRIFERSATTRPLSDPLGRGIRSAATQSRRPAPTPRARRRTSRRPGDQHQRAQCLDVAKRPIGADEDPAVVAKFHRAGFYPGIVAGHGGLAVGSELSGGFCLINHDSSHQQSPPSYDTRRDICFVGDRGTARRARAGCAQAGGMHLAVPVPVIEPLGRALYELVEHSARTIAG